MEQNGIGWNRVWNGMVNGVILDKTFKENQTAKIYLYPFLLLLLQRHSFKE